LISQQAQHRNSHCLLAADRLSPGMPIEQAQAEFALILAAAGADYRVLNITGKVKLSLVILIFPVDFVPATACATVANLLLARGAPNAGEFAIRGQLIGPLQTKFLLLTFSSGILGLLLTRAAFIAFHHDFLVSSP